MEIGQGHWKSKSSHSRFYITRATILLQDVVSEITTAHAKANDVVLEWDTVQSVYLPGVWVMMTNSSLRFALDWGVEIDVTRHVRDGTNQRGDSFLNVEVQNENRLSPDSSGLLGENSAFLFLVCVCVPLEFTAGNVCCQFKDKPAATRHGCMWAASLFVEVVLHTDTDQEPKRILLAACAVSETVPRVSGSSHDERRQVTPDL